MVIRMIQTEVQVKDLPETFTHPERYKSFKYIGGGSFGQVVLARDSVRDCNVAIKRIFVQRYENHVKNLLRDVKNLLREVAILQLAKNPQIVELQSIYMELQSENTPVAIYIVMKYCGENLVEYMAMNTVSLDDAAKIVYNIARGLNFLHKLEIYHRDLKPNNICIDLHDKRFPAKIIDLGFARKKPQNTNEITRMVATVCYRAPENLFGLKFKEKQDVWSLGCILGYLVSSKNIFRYLHRELRESSGTLMLILRHLGKPSEKFIDNLNENRMSIDRLLWRDFNALYEADDYNLEGDGFNTFFQQHIGDPKKDEALELIGGMLRWHHEDRMCIQEIIESNFVAGYREEAMERLPEDELCTKIKSILDENENEIREYEIKKDYNGLITNYLYNRIAEDFGWDEDLKDYYPYHPRSGSRRLALLQNLTTLAVISTVAGVVYNYRQHDSFSWKTFFSGAALVLTLSAVKRVLRC
ncbi:hypothetical protein ACHWQZ_G006406 [Mnemiopsis leidyi]